MWCNNGWTACSGGCGCQNSCGCQSSCGCGQDAGDDFSMEQVGTLPVFVSVPNWLANGRSGGGSCGCARG